mmetsp:Transcript_30487/g.116736  ORF Transcript_30487/g.116736 Transcript_30487/m.116736 type:complete len:125 (+) Transcript_30487:1388-1762(+)
MKMEEFLNIEAWLFVQSQNGSSGLALPNFWHVTVTKSQTVEESQLTEKYLLARFVGCCAQVVSETGCQPACHSLRIRKGYIIAFHRNIKNVGAQNKGAFVCSSFCIIGSVSFWWFDRPHDRIGK